MLRAMADITFHGSPIGILQVTPTPLTLSSGMPTAPTCPRENFVALRPGKGRQECQPTSATQSP
eukprot:3816401-Pyramimonas_sp.AAC.1